MMRDACGPVAQLLRTLDEVAATLGWSARFARREIEILEAAPGGMALTVNISFPDVGTGIEVGQVAPGATFRVWEVRGTDGSGDEPPDCWDVDILVTASLPEALESLLMQPVRQAVDAAWAIPCDGID